MIRCDCMPDLSGAACEAPDVSLLPSTPQPSLSYELLGIIVWATHLESSGFPHKLM